MRTLFIALLCGLALALHAVPVHSLYVDGVWSNLTGLSSSQTLRTGQRQGALEYHLYVTNEWYSTRGTDLPFQYEARGATVGVGARYWLPGNRVFLGASVGEVLTGANEGQTAARVGLAGYQEWQRDQRLTTLYGDLTCVRLADDTFLNVIGRHGRILRQDATGRWWIYGVGQLYASGQGANGTENRGELGLGVGTLYRGHLAAFLEARGGYSFRGAISERAYWNPTLIVAGSY